MITESFFPRDTRVRQEAYKLKEHGHKISIIAIKNRNQKYYERISGMIVYRIPKIEIFKYGKQLKLGNVPFFQITITLIKAILGYGFEYFYFTGACFLLSFLVLLKDKFDVIHLHSPPDTLFIVALFHKVFFRKKFIFDHHDLSPDLYIEKYPQNKKFIYRLLLLLEKISCRSADKVITTNDSYKKIEIERCGIDGNKVYVVRNGPDLKEMKISEPIENIRSKAKLILCYIGAINIQDGLDYLINVLSEIVFKYNYKDICLLIIGDGDYLNKIKGITNELDLNKYVVFTGFISNRNEINRLLSTADIFVDSAPYSFLNDNSTFIKHMEYMVFEKPVVSFALKESMFSLRDAGVFIPPNDTEKMAKKIIELFNNDQMRMELGSNARERVRELSWEKVSMPLIQAYESLEYPKVFC